MIQLSHKLLLTFAIYFIFTNPTPLRAVTFVGTDKPSPVSLTATVPGYWRLELTGWTSPYATVTFTMAQKIKVDTNADTDGKFTFVLILPHKLDPFCLIAKDIAGITSHPLCIAPPPPDANIVVKEVVMPPTINIIKGNIMHGETVAAQGYTTPNSEVVPFLFEENSKTSSVILSETKNLFAGTGSFAALRMTPLPIPNSNIHIFFRPAYAAELPKPSIKSDQNGFYQFNLPTTELGKNRIFIGSYFLNNPSPKSNILVFNILTYWQELFLKIINFIVFAIAYLLDFLMSMPGIILSELFAVILLILFLLRKKKTKALLINPDRALNIKPQRSLAVRAKIKNH